MSVRYLDLAHYVAIAAEVTGLDTDTVIRVAKLDLADSALHAPAAGFGETEFYPDFRGQGGGVAPLACGDLTASREPSSPR